MENNNKSHLFLLNPRGEKRTFDASRGITPTSINQKSAESYTPQKVLLGNAFNNFLADQVQRRQGRNLELPTHLEFIQIDFFVVFNNNDVFRNKAKFKNNFGLVPVAFSNFNQTVLFAIIDEELFGEFVRILNLFINSPAIQHPSGTDYAIITIIKNFTFISSNYILKNIEGGDILLSLVEPSEEIRRDFNRILNSLKIYLDERIKEQMLSDYHSDNFTTIQIKEASQNLIQEIANNFDIVYKIQSIRVPSIHPNIYNQPELTWGFNINPPKAKSVMIGVLDNGVRNIAPLENIILDLGLDITSKQPDALLATSPHGTVVATLSALGLDYFDDTRNTFTSDAWIVPIKILNFLSLQSYPKRTLCLSTESAMRDSVETRNYYFCSHRVTRRELCGSPGFDLFIPVINFSVCLFAHSNPLKAPVIFSPSPTVTGYRYLKQRHSTIRSTVGLIS